jgi:hypothetical protein
MMVDETKAMQSMVRFDLRLHQLDASLIKTRSKKNRSLFVEIFRSVPAGTPDERDKRPHVVKTEAIDCVVEKGLIQEANWESLKIPVNSLCRGDPNRPIVIELWENNWKSRTLIGSFTTTFGEMDKNAKEATDLELPMIGGGRGSLIMRSLQVERKDTFMDYIAGGLSINLFVAIDFTKSNKDSNLPDSLHSFVDPQKPNDYVKVIRSVGDILQSYDQDRKISVYGFGARLPPTYNHTSHCFACNGDFFDPEVVGVEEIINVYRKALDSVVLHGPTNFHEIIKLVADFTEVYADPAIGSQKYSVLLIMTDGVITDMKQTINEIVRAAEFPMSIVIVGIGDEDFGLMKILDGDEERLYSTDERKFASRDIVQFVKFNDFKDKPIEALASETLQEIPREVVNYFRSRDIAPMVKQQSVKEQEYNVDGTPVGMPSDIAKQLEVMKTEFFEQVTKVVSDIDEFEVYRIITEEKIPSRDLTYFNEIVNKAPRGKNVLTIPRPSEVDSPPSANKQRRPVSTVAASAGKSVASSPSRTISPQTPRAESPAPVIDMSKIEGPSEYVAQGKPIGSPMSSLNAEQRAQILGSFTLADLMGPPAGTSPPHQEVHLKPGQKAVGEVASTINLEGVPSKPMTPPPATSKSMGLPMQSIAINEENEEPASSN